VADDVRTPDTQTHRLKTWSDYWLALESGAKTFEVRRNDRGFQPGDILVLQEWNPSSEEYTGRELRRRVTYVLRDAERFGLRDGFVVLGLADDGVSAGCASNEGAQVAREQTTVHADPIVSGITDDMVEAAARSAFANMRNGVYEGWEFEDLEVHVQESWRAAARAALSAALAGCAVVQLPEPDGTYGDGQDIAWDVSDGNPVTAYVGTYGPTVDAPDGTPFTPEAAEENALALLAAAREARRLAAGSQVGDQHGG